MITGAAPGPGLAGRSVVVTRPRAAGANGDELVELLAAAGAEPLWFPAVRIEPPSDPAPLERAAARALAGGYDWVVFTSANAVAALLPRLRVVAGEGGPLALPEELRVACVGPATAAELATRGVAVDLIPEQHVAEALVAAMAEAAVLRGARVLFPRAAEARRAVPDGLSSLGATVDEVEAYRTERQLERAGELRRLLDAGAVDAVTFMSGSAVAGFVAGVGPDAGRAIVAAIGPVTAETARRHGLGVQLIAAVHTAAGLVRSLEEHWS